MGIMENSRKNKEIRGKGRSDFEKREWEERKEENRRTKKINKGKEKKDEDIR